MDTRVPVPVAGLATVFVVCTVSVSPPPVSVSPAVTLTGVEPDVPPDELIYLT